MNLMCISNSKRLHPLIIAVTVTLLILFKTRHYKFRIDKEVYFCYDIVEEVPLGFQILEDLGRFGVRRRGPNLLGHQPARPPARIKS